MKTQDRQVRNRRTATRLVTGVLLFHTLALASGVWLLRQASGARSDEGLRAMAVAVSGGRGGVAATPDAIRDAPREAIREAQPPSALPDWVLQANRTDTPAPWRTDDSGYVLLSAR